MGYRWCTILASVAACWSCSFAIYFIVAAIAKYRTDDFFEATSVKDFTTKGSCVESITLNQLKSARYDNSLNSGDDGCPSKSDPSEEGLPLAMRRSLAVSVHGIYYTYFVQGIDHETMRGVTETVVSATIGYALKPADDTMQLSKVNFSAAFEALRAVSEQAIPVENGCDTIYNIMGEGSITTDTAKDFLQKLRRGREDEDTDEDYEDWPIRAKDISVVCNDQEITAPTGTYIDVRVPLTTIQKEMMYAHCLSQFYFASSGTIPYETNIGFSTPSGTFNVPLVGEPAGPNALMFYPNAKGFNSTSDYNTKVRMYLGQRFGYSVWAYVPMLLATCYLCADAVVFFLAEATLPDVLLSTAVAAEDRTSMIRDSLVMAATSRLARGVRLSFGVLAVAVSWIFYGIFVIGPWGFVHTKMPRPVCEAEDPDHHELATWWYVPFTRAAHA